MPEFKNIEGRGGLLEEEACKEKVCGECGGSGYIQKEYWAGRAIPFTIFFECGPCHSIGDIKNELELVS